MTALMSLPRLNIVPQSHVAMEVAELGLERTAAGLRLAILASPLFLEGFEGESSEHAGRMLLVGPTSPRNAAELRSRLPWLRPQPLGLRTSAGMGDRMGLATPGHVRAMRAAGGNLAPIFAQQ